MLVALGEFRLLFVLVGGRLVIDGADGLLGAIGLTMRVVLGGLTVLGRLGAADLEMVGAEGFLTMTGPPMRLERPVTVRLLGAEDVGGLGAGELGRVGDGLRVTEGVAGREGVGRAGVVLVGVRLGVVLVGARLGVDLLGGRLGAALVGVRVLDLGVLLGVLRDEVRGVLALDGALATGWGAGALTAVVATDLGAGALTAGLGVGALGAGLGATLGVDLGAALGAGLAGALGAAFGGALGAGLGVLEGGWALGAAGGLPGLLGALSAKMGSAHIIRARASVMSTILACCRNLRADIILSPFTITLICQTAGRPYPTLPLYP